MNQLKDIANHLNLRLFDYAGYRTGSLNNVAEYQTQNCTHYYDAATLRYHGSRVVHAESWANGTLFATVCRDSLNMEKTMFGFRVVVHAIDGYCVLRGDLDSAHKTKAKALAEYRALRESFNAQDVLIAVFDRVERKRKLDQEYFDQAKAIMQTTFI